MSHEVLSRSADTEPSSRPRPRRAWPGAVLRLVVGLGLLAVLFNSIDVKDVIRTLMSVDPLFATLLSAAVVLRTLLMAFKWNLLLRTRGVVISFTQAIRLYYVGSIIGTLTPAGIGAEAYRIVALSRLGRGQTVASTVFIERLIGMLVILLAALVTLPFSATTLGPSAGTAVVVIVALSLVCLTVTALLLLPGLVRGTGRRLSFLRRSLVIDKARRFYLAVAEFRHHPRALLVFSALTVVELLVLITMSYLAAWSLHAQISFTYLLSVLPLAIILLRLPVSIHGLGVLEGLYAFFFAAAGFSGAIGVSVSILLRIAEAVLIWLPAGLMLAMRPVRIEATSA